jgi:DNA-binding transcriptional LysR family regulator
MDWEALRFVLAIARERSLLGAARRLGVSHPTVQRRLNRLEAELGARLFDRGRAGAIPTPAGEEAAALAARLDGDIVTLERTLAGRDLRPSGTLRVTTTDTLLGTVLIPVFAGFAQAYPEIRLDIVVSNESFNLSRRDADVAIRPTTRPPEALVGRRLADLGMALYRPGAPGPSWDLDSGPWIGFEDGLSHLTPARWMIEQELEDRVVMRLNSWLGILDAVAAGIGMAVLPCFLADPRPEVARLGAPIPALDGELWLLTHPDLRRVGRVRAFLDYVADALKPLRASLAGQ